MEVSDVRLRNLLLIIESVFGGRQVHLARRMQRKESQITQWKRGNCRIHEKSARLIEAAAGKPMGWLDVPHQSADEDLVVRDSVAPAPYFMRPSLRVALEVLCEELSRLEDPARLEGVAALLRSCAITSGDQAYIEPILTLMRFKSAPPTLPKQNAA
jgi:hypothetical protein